MKPYTLPFFAGWFTTLISVSLVFTGFLHEDVWAIFGWSGLISLFLGTIIGLVLTDLVYGYEINRAKGYEIPDLTRLELEGQAIHAIAGDMSEGDFIYDINPIKLQEIAKRILVTRNFTYATVGQTERPKLIEPFKKAGYIVYTGKGKYDVTPKGFEFCERLKASSPESRVFRHILNRSP